MTKLVVVCIWGLCASIISFPTVVRGSDYRQTSTPLDITEAIKIAMDYAQKRGRSSRVGGALLSWDKSEYVVFFKHKGRLTVSVNRFDRSKIKMQYIR
jgi:hypothetical protein